MNNDSVSNVKTYHVIKGTERKMRLNRNHTIAQKGYGFQGE